VSAEGQGERRHFPPPHGFLKKEIKIEIFVSKFKIICKK
jgi:hypothetical protein